RNRPEATALLISHGEIAGAPSGWLGTQSRQRFAHGLVNPQRGEVAPHVPGDGVVQVDVDRWCDHWFSSPRGWSCREARVARAESTPRRLLPNGSCLFLHEPIRMIQQNTRASHHGGSVTSARFPSFAPPAEVRTPACVLPGRGGPGV